MSQHKDRLNALNYNSSLSEQLEVIHDVLKQQFPSVVRIAVASYDEKSGALKTFISSNPGKTPLAQYEASLVESSSLLDIYKTGKSRVVNDLSVFDQGQQKHTQAIKEAGLAASYTLPMYQNGTFWGVVFFNSDQQNCFTPEVLSLVDVYGHLVSSLVTHEITAIKTLLAALKTANDMVHFRDPETGGHLERMSRFARLIAQELACQGDYEFNDEFIERIFMFAPMHDVGKIGIPDDVLLKPGKLTEKEFQIMRSHTNKGKKLVDDMIDNFGLDLFHNIDVLRNIAECHHEALDGSGYPNRYTANNIPIEAKIIAVADIFDALTSQRPYKEPWDNDKAFRQLQELSKDKLDKNCVDALVRNPEKVAKIQESFQG